MELFVERVADDARGYRWMLARSVAVIDGKPLPLATFDQRRWHGRSTDQIRSEERRVGKECVCTCRSRWSPYQQTKKHYSNTPLQPTHIRHSDSHHLTPTPSNTPVL